MESQSRKYENKERPREDWHFGNKEGKTVTSLVKDCARTERLLVLHGNVKWVSKYNKNNETIFIVINIIIELIIDLNITS